jgi:type II secretory pathway pseudopilin PulG
MGWTRRVRTEAGFTLVEALVAAVIVVILFAAFAAAMATAFRGARINHAAQAATALSVEHLEFARSVSWAELAMIEVAENAPLIDAAQQLLLASEAGLEADEPLVVSPSGLIPPVIEESVDLTEYTVWQYVSTVDEGIRRVVVYVTWQEGSVGYSHLLSGLLSEVATR